MRRKRSVGLGALELDVMKLVWKENKPVMVKEIWEKLYETDRLAYTTVMTVMNRLGSKDVLVVDKSVVPYVYKANLSKEQYLDALFEEVEG